MPKWLELLISASLGLIAGIAADPLKTVVNNYANGHAAKAALYAESTRYYTWIGRLQQGCGLLDTINNTSGWGAPSIWKCSPPDGEKKERAQSIADDIDLSLFTYYTTTQAEAYHKLGEAPVFSAFYQRLHNAKDNLSKGEYETGTGQLHDAYALFIRALTKGSLEYKLVHQYEPGIPQPKT